MGALHSKLSKKVNIPLPNGLSITIDRKIVVDGVDYEFLGSGRFNVVYVNKKNKEVLKKPISARELTDLPERAVRLWNLINPDYQARLTKDGQSWIVSLIEGVLPTDDEIAQSIVDIFNQTGRIVIDADVSGNFIKTKIKTTEGKTVEKTMCVDIGSALQLLPRISDISIAFWSVVRPRQEKELNDLQNQTVLIKMIKALLFLQKFVPDMNEASPLVKDKFFFQTTAAAYSAHINNDENFQALHDKVISIINEKNYASADRSLFRPPSYHI
ncbi:MAG: hypothetical protein NTZ67_01505 [Gammaproteobacteria bacterium]|nr:hypothetical protein [Gammaproteobacteria bacterium]